MIPTVYEVWSNANVFSVTSYHASNTLNKGLFPPPYSCETRCFISLSMLY
jgi:hypothetical protein